VKLIRKLSLDLGLWCGGIKSLVQSSGANQQLLVLPVNQVNVKQQFWTPLEW